MVTDTRWRTAQDYERGYWQGVARDARDGAAGRLSFYAWRAELLASRLVALGLEELAGPGARVLEVGSGPIGIVSHLDAGIRVAVDPLETFYSGLPEVVERRDPGVQYRPGMGEALPVDDEAFDLVIMENCLDHTRDMHVVMAEIRRALRPGGVLYLTVNARSRPGFVVHRALSRLRIDSGHPHTFTAGRARRFLRRTGFEELHYETESLWEAWVADLRGPGLRPRLKGLLGVSEHVVTLFGRRP